MSYEMKSNSDEYVNNGTKSKIDRYSWNDDLGDEGVFMKIDKNLLHVDLDYQRDKTISKIQKISAEFRWDFCGAIGVSERDGKYFVFDGQHRVAAAMRRSDVTAIPCMVFSSSGKKEEAKAFLGTNTLRKPITSYGRHKARVVSGDELAIFIEGLWLRLGLGIVDGGSAGPMQLKSVSVCYKLAQASKSDFVDVMEFVAAVCRQYSVPATEKLIDGLFYLHTHGIELTNSKTRKRILVVGPERLTTGATRAAALYAKGGQKVWAEGMLVEINKGSRTTYEMTM